MQGEGGGRLREDDAQYGLTHLVTPAGLWMHASEEIPQSFTTLRQASTLLLPRSSLPRPMRSSTASRRAWQPSHGETSVIS